MPLSEEKQFALEVLDVVDELIRPDINRPIVQRFWGWFTGYAKGRIKQKPDHEIRLKLLVIHKKLNTRFQDINNSVEISEAEKLGAIKIPNVGHLAKIKNLTSIDKEQAKQLEKELFRC